MSKEGSHLPHHPPPRRVVNIGNHPPPYPVFSMAYCTLLEQYSTIWGNETPCMNIIVIYLNLNGGGNVSITP